MQTKGSYMNLCTEIINIGGEVMYDFLSILIKIMQQIDMLN